MNVGTAHLTPGTFVHTKDDGTDFDIPLAKPTTGTVRSTIREVKSVVGGVVRFTDGTKTKKLHGRTAWRVATDEEVLLS